MNTLRFFGRIFSLFGCFQVPRPPLCGWLAVARRVALTYAATMIVTLLCSICQDGLISFAPPNRYWPISGTLTRVFVTPFVTFSGREIWYDGRRRSACMTHCRTRRFSAGLWRGL